VCILAKPCSTSVSRFWFLSFELTGHFPFKELTWQLLLCEATKALLNPSHFPFLPGCTSAPSVYLNFILPVLQLVTLWLHLPTAYVSAITVSTPEVLLPRLFISKCAIQGNIIPIIVLLRQSSVFL
jgi:hypothetical protein